LRNKIDMAQDNQLAINSVQTTAQILERAVRTIGTFRPKFNPKDGKVFSDELTVLGTAFWLKDYKVLITCAHVVDQVLKLPLESAGLLVVGNHEAYQRAVVNIVDHQHDLAVISLVDSNTGNSIDGKIIESESSNGLLISSQYPEAGRDVAWAGYPLGNQLLNQIQSPTYAEGVVGISKKEGLTRKDIQVSGVVVGGYSGSPVVDKKDGKIVGVVSGGPQNSGIFMAVSFEHIKALAELAKS